MDRTTKILEFIRKNPGTYTRQITKSLKLSNGVVQYHVEKLEKMGKIRIDKRTRYKRHYSIDVDTKEFPIIANLRKKSKQKLIFAILSANEPNFEEIVHKMHQSPSTVHWNLSGLLDDGILEKVTKDRKTIYRIKNKKLLKKTFENELSKLFKDSFEHTEDVFMFF